MKSLNLKLVENKTSLKLHVCSIIEYLAEQKSSLHLEWQLQKEE